MTCKIQWVDSDGNPTPDSNRAVVMVRARESVLVRHDGSVYTAPPSEWFLCCADHVARISPNWEIAMLPRNGGGK